MDYASELVKNAVEEIAQLPGIGKRTALRLVLHLLRQPASQSEQLAEAIKDVRTKVQYCKKCHNISDKEICDICLNLNRDQQLICVVEDIRDVLAIEATAQFEGLYHVLGGKISPIEGIGPQQLQIPSLINRIKKGTIKELIFALSNTMEGDTTNFYIYKQLGETNLKISTIARGISVGDELEYADETTLGRSIQKRIPFDGSL